MWGGYKSNMHSVIASAPSAWTQMTPSTHGWLLSHESVCLEKEKTGKTRQRWKWIIHWRHEMSGVEEIQKEDKHSAESRVPELESCCFSSGEQLLEHVEVCYHYQSGAERWLWQWLLRDRNKWNYSVLENSKILTGMFSAGRERQTNLEICRLLFICINGYRNKPWR